MNNSKFSFAAAVVWLIIVTVLLTLPGTEFPKATWFSKVWLDEWIHIGLFSVLVLIWCRSFSLKICLKQDLKKTFMTIAIMSLVYGIIMEIVQHFFIPFRSFELADIIADGVGSYIGYFYSKRRWIKIEM